jgi:hypothetical protein
MSTDAESGARSIEFEKPTKKSRRIGRREERKDTQETTRGERKADPQLFRKKEKKRRQVKRSEKFRKNQPRIKATAKAIQGISGKKESTNGKAYSPGPSSFDTAMGNLIDSLTMRRGSK